MRNGEKKDWKRTTDELLNALNCIEFDELPIADESKRRLKKNVKALPYYAKIYATCLQGLDDVENSELVDYGGGCAFLSQFAKLYGVAKVIYVDISSESTHAAEELTRKLGLGPDAFVCGDSQTLKNWCKANNVAPDYLVSVDVIEHIYDLDTFFADLLAVNPSMKMVFTTASNPCNTLKVKRLRKTMIGDETGTCENPNFYTLRREYIRSQYPDFDENRLNHWASATRGLVFDDIKAVVDGEKPLPAVDGYNTCDPATGSWTERVLPLSEYKRLLSKYKRVLCVENGFYDTNRPQPQKAFRVLLNGIIRMFPRMGRCIAPFIILKTKY